MGNWLKGRVLINDVSQLIPENNQGAQVASSQQNYQNNSLAKDSKSNHMRISFNSTLYLPIPPSIDQSDFARQIFYPPPNSSTLLQFTEEEQIQLAKRIGLIQHLPIGIYDGDSSTKNLRECVICMVEFSKGDCIRFLPCLHTYHVHCIDDWLMRSFICPSCMESVDVLLSTS